MKVRALLSVVALLVAAHIAIGSARPSKPAPPPSSATLSTEALAKMGIHREHLSLVGVSNDGATLVAWERQTDPKHIAKGLVDRLHILREAKGQWTGQAVWLPSTSVHQLAISEDGRWAMVVADEGMCVVAVDLTSATAHVVSRFKGGESGFRVRPYVVWPEGGKFAALGYYQDADGASHDDSIVSIDPAGTTPAAIQPLRNIVELNKATSGARATGWHSSSQAVFAGLHPDKCVHLYVWTGKELQDVDQAMDYLIMPGNGRVICLANRKGGPEALVIDLLTLHKQPIKLPEGKRLSYPLMSFDGSTILMSAIDFKAGHMSTWYGRLADGWTLHPLDKMQNVFSGALRLSPGGESLALLNNDGITVVHLPSK